MRSSGKNKKVFHSILIMLLLFAILLIASFGIYKISQENISEEVTNSVLGNMDACTNYQRETTLSTLDEIFSTLRASAVVVEQDESQEFVEQYFDALNKADEEIGYVYATREDLENALAAGQDQQNTEETMTQLENGEESVSRIVYSEENDSYSITCSVPVRGQSGELQGAAQAVIDAKLLIGSDTYEQMDCQILWALITDAEGNIVPVKNEDKAWEGNIFDHLQEQGITQENLLELKSSVASSEYETQSEYLGEVDKLPVYVAETDMQYNGWHLFTCIQAKSFSNHVTVIAQKTMLGSMAQMALVFLVGAAGFVVWILTRMKQTAEEDRYLLIEQFSDVVLFDYDCERDIMRFTPNISKFASVKGVVQKDFMENLDEKNIYQSDQLLVRQLLAGKFPEDMTEIRLRVMRPDGEKYFWCLMQCQYVYKKDKLKSIIGKLDDIDRKQEEEEHLFQLAQNDQLTGLNNRSTVEEKIRESMNQEEEGLLFVIDIDKFQQVNDTYGHMSGDHILRHIGNCAKKAFRNDDIKGRIGGDQLIVFAVGTNSREVAERKAEQLEKYLAGNKSEGKISITASVGISRYPSDGNRYEELFDCADQAMYQAKNQGGGKIVFFEDMGTQA
ncbi:MAG: GGDEF domain-containing protein [Clostridia bacterium]|nr:GGDEF domain-containing protein [Clostridia bacterium]NCC42148.1 GGDEF domain-containing protein [Clostridia bacterium]